MPVQSAARDMGHFGEFSNGGKISATAYGDEYSVFFFIKSFV